MSLIDEWHHSTKELVDYILNKISSLTKEIETLRLKVEELESNR